MHEYIQLVNVLNGIEKEDMNTLLEVDSYPLVGHSSKVIGITGPQGAGKSTFLAEMINKLLKEDQKVGVLLIDPTDPYTHGAFLGDRIRFNRLPTHKNLFIRSIATRGFLGGLTLYTPLFIKAFAKFGFPTIFVETVGTGQNEVDIYKAADVNVYITSPDIGDSMQVLKGGSMNNFDMIVINKEDLPGADRAENLIRRNSNLLNTKKNLRIVKHRRGQHSSLNKVYQHILDIFDEVDVFTQRKDFVSYYQKKIFLYLVENNLNSILNSNLSGNGEDVIRNVLSTYQQIFVGR